MLDTHDDFRSTREGRRLFLVTGASAGIGAALAEACARRGFDLALTARRTDRLQALAERLARAHGIEAIVLPEDLSDPAAPGRLVARIEDRGRRIDGLVNNAGYGLRGAFADQSAEEQRAFLQVLTLSVAELCRLTVPDMAARGYGRVVNVASLLGLMPGLPGHTLYSAAKAFVVALSEGLHLETRGRGVHVSVLCPGLTRSEFHHSAAMADSVARAPAWMWMEARPVAEAGLRAVEANQAFCVPGRRNRAIARLSRGLPRRLALEAMERAAGG